MPRTTSAVEPARSPFPSPDASRNPLVALLASAISFIGRFPYRGYDFTTNFRFTSDLSGATARAKLRPDQRLGYFKYWNRVRFCTLAKDSSAACSAVTPSL